MKLELNAEQLDQLIVAAADGERLYRRMRQDVRDGVVDHYTEEQCTENMLRYRKLHSTLSHKYYQEYVD
jgi:hypothetical protein